MTKLKSPEIEETVPHVRTYDAQRIAVMGLRYHVIERTTFYAFMGDPYHFNYWLIASFELKCDMMRFAETFPRTTTLILVDELKGELL